MDRTSSEETSELEVRTRYSDSSAAPICWMTMPGSFKPSRAPRTWFMSVFSSNFTWTMMPPAKSMP